tara:strand:+ start:2058 stop:2270 length:213 start_codon:yes stop_codon:yes gene_type:complete
MNKIIFHTTAGIGLTFGALSMVCFCSSLFLSLDPANLFNAFGLMTCAFGSLFLGFVIVMIAEDLRVRNNY